MKIQINEEQIKRKIIAVAAFLMVIFLLFTSLPVHAQSATVLKIQPDSTDVGVGETVQVSVYITGGTDVNAFDVGIRFDPAIVSLESFQTGSFLSNLAKFYEENQSGYKRLAYAQLATAGVSGDGTLITYTFKGLQPGNSDIQFDVAELSNSASQSISLSSQNGVIHVVSAATGTATATPTPTSPSPLTPTATQTQTHTPTFTPSATSTFTVTPTVTRTATLTKTPTRTSTITLTPTRTRTPINTLVFASSTPVTPVFPGVTLTTAPTSTSAAFLTLTQLPIPNTGNETPSPTSDLDSGKITPTSTLPIVVTGGQASGGWFSQFVCVFTIFLLIALLILLAILLRRRKNDASTSGN